MYCAVIQGVKCPSVEEKHFAMETFCSENRGRTYLIAYSFAASIMAMTFSVFELADMLHPELRINPVDGLILSNNSLHSVLISSGDEKHREDVFMFPKREVLPYVFFLSDTISVQ